MSEQVPSVGIDFGTTNSCVTWYDPRKESAEVILNAEGQTKTPSVVYFGENETLVGEHVEELLKSTSTDRAQRAEVLRRTIVSIKRNLLAPPRIALPGGRFVRPTDVVAEILKKLKRDAEEGHFHEEVGRAVITCPAEFNVLQRRKIEEAGHLAGFDEVVLLEEPVAGALAYTWAGLDVGKHVLVYDLGGGTFDLAILDNEDESFHVAMEPKGVERCGGDDFDHALYYHCDELARKELGRPISLTGDVDLSFMQECRRRKESLTYQEQSKFGVYLSSDNGPVRFEHEVGRQTFETLIEEYIETSSRLTEEILEQASAADHEVDTVVLIGGSVRVPLVVRTLQETLPVSPLGFDKRDVAVALGAAYYTTIRWPGSRGTKTETGIETPGTATDQGTTTDPKPLGQYQAAVEEVFSDKKLSKVEVDRLNAFARQLGLKREQTADVERHVMGNAKEGLLFQQYRRAVEMIWADEKLNRLEVEWLEALTDELGLNKHQTSYAETAIIGDTKEAILSRQDLSVEDSDVTVNFALVCTLSGHSGEVNSVVFNRNGQHLASGASDHTVRGWDVRTGQSVGALDGHTGRVSCVTFSPDGELLTSGGFDERIRIWKLPKGQPFHTLNHPGWVYSVAFSPDGKTLVSGGADREIRLWNLETGQLLRSVTGHSHWILCVAISPDGRFLVSGGADKTLKVWNLETGVPLHTFEHPGWVCSVAIGPAGRHLVSGGEDGMIRTFDLETGRSVCSITGHSASVRSVAVSPEERLLYSGGSDGKVKVWNLRTGEPLHILPGHPEGVGSIALSPDGELLASGGCDCKIKVWRKVETKGPDAPGLEGEPAPARSLYEHATGQSGRLPDLPD